MTALVGLVFGAPAARLKGLYLAIATLAAQFILEDFFARAQWFTGGVAGRITEPFDAVRLRVATGRRPTSTSCSPASSSCSSAPPT